MIAATLPLYCVPVSEVSKEPRVASCHSPSLKLGLIQAVSMVVVEENAFHCWFFAMA